MTASQLKLTTPFADRPGLRLFRKNSMLRRLVSRPSGAIGVTIVVLVLISAAWGGALSPYSASETFSKENPAYDPRGTTAESFSRTIALRLDSPSWAHPLGTDELARDVLSRIIHSSSLSVKVGLLSAILSVIAGTAVGLISGYFGRWVDTAIQRIVDSMIAFPAIVLLLVLVQVSAPSVRSTVLALGFLGTWGVSRIVRASTMQIMSEVYVEAARSLGARDGRIIVRHVAPNIVAPLIVVFTLLVGTNILSEASISFLGLGVPQPSWGKTVAEGRGFLNIAPWVSLSGAGAIVLTVLGVNLVGDALRDLLDPRMRGRM